MSVGTPQLTTVGVGATALSEERVHSGWVFALLAVTVLGLAGPAFRGGNDISRWCTVWSLVERHTFAIDACPWRDLTEDRVLLARPESPSVKRFYSSKPAFLSALAAGILYPIRAISGVPMQDVVRPTDAVSQIMNFFYFKFPLLLLNVLPFLIFVAYFIRHTAPASGSSGWILFSGVTALLGHQLMGFNGVLNNHCPAAYCVALLVVVLRRSFLDRCGEWRHFLLGGLAAGLAVAFDLGTAPFAIGAVALFFSASAPLAARFVVPPLLAVAGIYALLQFVLLGRLGLAYQDVGTSSYLYPGSYWLSPGGFDQLNATPESRWVYLFNMVLGHHGVFLLTPVAVLPMLYVSQIVFGRTADRRQRYLAAVVAGSFVIGILFYLWNPWARNYGGKTQGLRWLFWTIPLWLSYLPASIGWLRRGRADWLRWLLIPAMIVSLISAYFAWRAPWSDPWVLSIPVLVAQ